jgi:hypothetical protein
MINIFHHGFIVGQNSTHASEKGNSRQKMQSSKVEQRASKLSTRHAIRDKCGRTARSKERVRE